MSVSNVIAVSRLELEEVDHRFGRDQISHVVVAFHSIHPLLSLMTGSGDLRGVLGWAHACFAYMGNSGEKRRGFSYDLSIVYSDFVSCRNTSCLSLIAASFAKQRFPAGGGLLSPDKRNIVC